MTVQVDSLVRALDIVDQTPPRDAALPAFGKAACCAVALVLDLRGKTGEAMPARLTRNMPNVARSVAKRIV
jgi:hypothetical protein